MWASACDTISVSYRRYDPQVPRPENNITELLNSAVEAAIDRISDDKHRLSARAKDLGSAAVFISLWLAGITWTLIGYDRIFG